MDQTNKVRICRGCGAEIRIMKTETVYKNVMVEAETVWIRLASGGNVFYTADGRPVFGYLAGDADDDPDTNFLEAYIPHLGNCPNNGKAPRKRRGREDTDERNRSR